LAVKTEPVHGTAQLLCAFNPRRRGE